MALLTLKDIGKIYVSEGNVAVGIRGVNLSFNQGEFVAITGKSGSGKSTLLNVISGMDSYEEGEMYIENQSTSHYLQPEWEEYRQKYISFIFQDYNIIESFTVLQNVELALMHIEDKKERRKRALELINRVGLSSHVKQKGSKLSGGQKQRTVIARALAKDSKIILADEPTGNLDAATSVEIIKLLKEVSKDKLLIVVTHNFEQVEEYATRHIRIFDGAVESDHVIKRVDSDISYDVSNKNESIYGTAQTQISHKIKNGITLGHTIFKAKPKLSFFLCILMVVGMLGIFMVTTMCGDAMDLLKDSYMFKNIEGRVVIVKRNGGVISESELKSLSEKYGAKSTLHFDMLLDQQNSTDIRFYNKKYDDYDYAFFEFTYGEDFGDNIVGRYPEKEDEVFLNVPISYQPIFGKKSIENDEIIIYNMKYKITGVKYYYDNNIVGKCLFTSEGFRTATAIYYLMHWGNLEMSMNVAGADGTGATLWPMQSKMILPSSEVEDRKIYVNDDNYQKLVSDGKHNTSLEMSSIYYDYAFDYLESSTKEYIFRKEYTNNDFTSKKPVIEYKHKFNYEKPALIVHPSVLRDMAEEYFEKAYKQASMFFENNEDARAAADKMQNEGYIAVTADTTYKPDAFAAILNTIACVMLLFVWIIFVLFLAFFVNLCSSRALGAFKGDMAIMRSMGIPVKVIRIGMYVRMLISLIPSVVIVIAAAVLIFTSPKFNGFFVYLYAWQYALMFAGMLILTIHVTHKQIRKLFGESVKKSLKGGAAE